MRQQTTVIEDTQVTFVPANEASWEDLQAILGTADAGHCQCQRFKIRGLRGRGLTYLLARATIDHARTRGARALEAYPMLTQPGRTITWGELHVGPHQAFEEAGFHQVTHPTLRRTVLRIDFPSP